MRSVACYQVTCQPQTHVVKPHRRRLLSPLWPSPIEPSWGFLFCTTWFLLRPDQLALKFHTSDRDATTTVTCCFLQLVFTVSDNPGNSLWNSCVKTWHQGWAPSTLSLWVECSTVDKKLQPPTSPSGRKVWEVWSLVAEHAPSPQPSVLPPSGTRRRLSTWQTAPRKSQHPPPPC